MDKTKSETEVYVTSDHDLFSLVPSNRRVRRDHVLKIKKSIQHHNLLNLYPILVTAEGQVLDGQHRLAAAKELGLPIYYIVTPNGAAVMDIALTNYATKHWTREDYLHHWSSQGRDHYVVLKEFWERYKSWMSLSMASAVCIGEPANSTLTDGQRDLFNRGEYRITDMRFATMFAAAVKDFLVHFKYAAERPFVAALSELLRNPRYEQERMKEKLEKYPGMLVRCPDKERYLGLLEDLYNYHGRGDRIRFL